VRQNSSAASACVGLPYEAKLLHVHRDGVERVGGGLRRTDAHTGASDRSYDGRNDPVRSAAHGPYQHRIRCAWSESVMVGYLTGSYSFCCEMALSSGGGGFGVRLCTGESTREASIQYRHVHPGGLTPRIGSLDMYNRLTL